MFTNPGFTLGDQIFWMVDLFCKTMAAEGCKRRIGLFSVAIWSRVKRFERRFLALYAEWKAGTLPKARGVRAKDTSPRPSPHSGEGACGTGGAGAAVFDPGAHDAASFEWAKQRPASVLPRGFAGLRSLVPMGAGTLASMLGPLLTEHPEMRAFVTEAPQAGRMLRPICEMIGLKPPEWLMLPKRVRKKKEPPRLSETDEAELRRITAWFPDSPAGRRGKRIWRRMFEGKPVDLTKVSAVVLGLVLHAPRDGNCPPPEIGYGGRWPRLPKDYVRPKDWD